MVGGAGRDRVRLAAAASTDASASSQLVRKPMSKPASERRTSAPMIRDSRMLPTCRSPGRPSRPSAPARATHAEAEVARDRRDLSRVVGLDAADRDERVAALRERLGGEVLELAHLVAAVGEARVAVLALGPDLDPPPRCSERRSRRWTGEGPNVSGTRGKSARLMWTYSVSPGIAVEQRFESARASLI